MEPTNNENMTVDSPVKKVKRVRKRRTRKGSKKARLGIVLTVAVACISAVTLLVAYFRDEVAKEQAQARETIGKVTEEKTMQSVKDFSELLEARLIQAEQAVEEREKLHSEKSELRPRYVQLDEENASDFVTIKSCLINAATEQVDIHIQGKGLPKSDDGYYYLFEEKLYEDSVKDGLEGKEPILQEKKDVEMTFSVKLRYNSESSRLLSKFWVAVLKDGKYVKVSRRHYISNPEAVARYSVARSSTTSKKGLLVDPAKLRGSELTDLGVKHAAYNIPLRRLLGATTNGLYPTVHYTYNGRNYIFNGQVVAEYDLIFSSLTQKGITTTAIILNDMNPGYMQLIHPKARSGGSAPYYAFNATDQDGCEYMAAIATFLASRYSGGSHGAVQNWVIGNEVNARKEWNYIEYMDTDSYAREYADAMRVFYYSILSVNSNARVYVSMDQQWAKGIHSDKDYGARPLLQSMNRYTKEFGDFNWGVAFHPYNFPLNEAKAWKSSGKYGSYVTDSQDTRAVTIRNIHVLTDFLQQEEMRDLNHNVRSVILSEMGYTSSAGQDIQAASFVYAYKIVEANQYIDSMLLSRETDAASECAQGLALGLSTQGGGKKSIYNAFKYVDTAESAKYTDFALKVIGISDWNQVVTKR